MSLAIMLICMGMFIYIVQAVVVQFFLGPITKAESERSSKRCLKYIVHQLFLVACIASDVDSAVEVRLWSFYLFGALTLYKMRRGLCYVERHLDSISVLGFSEGGASSFSGEGEEKRTQTSTTRSIWIVLFLLVATLAMLNVILYPELLTIFDSSGSDKGNKDIHVSPLFMYDSMSFLFAVALLALKYLVLLQEQANEEKEPNAEEEEWQQRRQGERREEDGSNSSSSRSKPSPPPSPASSILGMEEEALLKWGIHLLNFALALLTIVHHIHAWCLKGIQGNVTDLLFFLLLHRWLWRIIILARAAWNAHILAKMIHTLFPEASPADLCEQEEADVCPICLKALRSRVKKLPCNHLIHSACLLQCLEKCGAGAAATGSPRRQGQQQQQQQQQGHRAHHHHGARSTAASLGNWLISEKAARCPLCRSALIPLPIAAEEEENDGNEADGRGFADRGGATRMFSEAAMPHRTNLGRGGPIATQTRTQSTTRWTNSRSSAFISVNENASTTTSTLSLQPPPSAAAQTSSSPLIPSEEVDAHDHMAAAAMEERPLFRFSTEDLPGFDWFPLALPQFTLEVMRRQAPTANITNIVATGGGRGGSTAERDRSLSSQPPAQAAAGSVVRVSSEGGQQGNVASAARVASSGGDWRAVTRWLPSSMGRQRQQQQQQQQQRG